MVSTTWFPVLLRRQESLLLRGQSPQTQDSKILFFAPAMLTPLFQPHHGTLPNSAGYFPGLPLRRGVPAIYRMPVSSKATEQTSKSNNSLLNSYGASGPLRSRIMSPVETIVLRV